ncbi:hypothetical protein BJX70DRAFT_379018 [Aspergillus crustosus]
MRWSLDWQRHEFNCCFGIALGLLSVLEAYLSELGISPNERSIEVACSCWELVFRILLTFDNFDLPAGHQTHLRLLILAFFILMEADPRMSITFAPKTWFGDGILYKLQCDGIDYAAPQLNRYDLVIALTLQLKTYIEEHGRQVSLKTLVGWWLGPYAKDLQDPIDWMIERGGVLNSLERQQFKQIFGDSLRPLVTAQAAEELRRWPRDDTVPR